ncbi:MAG: division/cell wall cluster transcriptional repressor MraZ [Acidimicrobiia bacterium]
MFLGEYHHTVDEKGRVVLPSKFRDLLLRGAIVSKGDGCLFIYTQDEFESVASELREKSKTSKAARQAARSFFAGATDVTPDKQGRLTIPLPLRQYANLEKEVTVLGVYSRIEIWNSDQWSENQVSGDQSLADIESLPDIGI